MTPMMAKVLCDAIGMIERGEAGYAIQLSHYERFRGMRKMVDRLVSEELVEASRAVKDCMILVPTSHARDMMKDRCPATSLPI